MKRAGLLRWKLESLGYPRTPLKWCGLDSARSKARSKVRVALERLFDGLVLPAVSGFGILQHSLRDRMAAAGDGPVRSHQRADLNRDLHVHGGPGTGLVGKWAPHRQVCRQSQDSCSPLLRSGGIVDWYFRTAGSIPVVVGTKTSGVDGSIFFGGLLRRIGSLPCSHPDSMVRLHGRDHTAGD